MTSDGRRRQLEHKQMRVLRRLPAGELLTAWGRHEALGRFRDEIPPDILQLIEEDRAEGREHALAHGILKRAPVIAAVQAAYPTLVVEIEVTGNDLDDLQVMCRPTDPPRRLAAHAEALLAAPGDEADHARNLAAGEMPVVGPFVAVARTVPGPLTIVDGVHRGSAWVAHLRAGRHYPLAVAVILTLYRTVFESAEET